MPYEDAMKLIARNFEAYLIELRAKSARSVTPLVTPPAGRPVLPPTHVVPAAVPSVVAKPEFVLPDSDTHYLLNLLADNRYLTLDELHKVLRYLELRYDRLARSQGVPCHRGDYRLFSLFKTQHSLPAILQSAWILMNIHQANILLAKHSVPFLSFNKNIPGNELILIISLLSLFIF